ncbi:MAG TPA: hypothetical protein VGQ10_05475 [Vicinamibacterales bacterium]|jgi:hypothetical protein|nr:hypothetical protein [Vicinamibacterales bacterium]
MKRAEVPHRAVLVRRQAIDIADVSRTGCRLEGSVPLSIGVVGMLAVEIAGHSHVEMFRVSRCGVRPDAEGRYEAGVEFLPLPADAPSLHDLLAQFDRQ